MVWSCAMTEHGRSGKENQESKLRKMKRRRTIKDDLEVENDRKILDLKVEMKNSNEWRKRIDVEEPYSRSRSLRIMALTLLLVHGVADALNQASNENNLYLISRRRICTS